LLLRAASYQMSLHTVEELRVLHNSMPTDTKEEIDSRRLVGDSYSARSKKERESKAKKSMKGLVVGELVTFFNTKEEQSVTGLLLSKGRVNVKVRVGSVTWTVSVNKVTPV
jgi:hypothetical protein